MSKKKNKSVRKKKNRIDIKALSRDIALCITGSLIYCAGVNLFIRPSGLYSGGFTGISQLLSLLAKGTFLEPYNLQGIIYFIINIPLIVIGWIILGKGSVFKTVLTVIIQSILLSVIPIPAVQIIEDLLVNTILGAVLEGVGCGILYYGYGSSGGTDILGMVFSKKIPGMTIGRVSLAVNFVVYTACAIIFNITTAVYCVIAAAINSYVSDKLHLQNKAVTVNVFTSNPERISNWVMKELNRDTTVIKGVGSYSGREKEMIVCVMSEYEYGRLKRHIKELDPTAFAYVNPSASVLGRFEKRLSR